MYTTSSVFISLDIEILGGNRWGSLNNTYIALFIFLLKIIKSKKVFTSSIIINYHDKVFLMRHMAINILISENRINVEVYE